MTATLEKLQQKTHRSSYSYSMNTKEYRSVFSINKGALYGDEHKSISSLFIGDQIIVLVKERDAAGINKKGLLLSMVYQQMMLIS